MDIKKEKGALLRNIDMKIFIWEYRKIQNRDFLLLWFLLINGSSTIFSFLIVYLLTYRNEVSNSGSLLTD